jgi:SAM-dependent methyltransferase
MRRNGSNSSEGASSGEPLVPDLDFSASGHLYGTHSLHPFAARCPPPLVQWAIDRYSSADDVVVDPMCGSGTTVVEALLAGRHAAGADVDPLARLITCAKTATVDPAELYALADSIEELTKQGSLDDGWRPELPNLGKWFLEDVSRDLAALRVAIGAAVPNPSAARDVAWAVFSSLIVARTSVANARDLVHSRHHWREWEHAPNVIGIFLRKLRRAGRLHEEYGRLLSEAGVARRSVLSVGTDARALELEESGAGLVFTSPPYCSALDYTRAHIFAVAWLADILGVSTAQYRAMGRRYVGSERAPLAEASRSQPLPPPTGHGGVDEVVDALRDDRKRAWIVQRYFVDMGAVLKESARVVKPGGHVILVVCPSNIRKVRVATHELFAEIAPAVSADELQVEQTYERTIHDHRRVMPYLESAFGERMRTEYVVVLRKREADQSIIRSLEGAGSTATISGRAIEVNETIA